jgi:hypothetical protein
MNLMGQAFFSREIMRRYNPRSLETVAIRAQGDAEMEALCREFDIKVEIIRLRSARKCPVKWCNFPSPGVWSCPKTVDT